MDNSLCRKSEKTFSNGGLILCRITQIEKIMKYFKGVSFVDISIALQQIFDRVLYKEVAA